MGDYTEMANERIAKLNCKTRKDSVILVDTFLGGSHEFLAKMNPAEQHEFLKHAYEFMVKNIGEDNILSAVVHMDEKTPHLHLVFTPITEDGRLSAKEVLGNQQKYIKWQDKFHAHMQSKWKDLQRGESAKETGRKHLHVYEFKRVTKEIENLEKRLQEINSENVENISAQDVALMKNQLKELQKKLNQSEEKANAPIVEIEISSDEKMGAVREKLIAGKITFAETAHGFSVPKYAEKFVNDTLSEFKPNKNYTNFRDRLALDVDESIYFSDNFDGLLKNLESKGYEIKQRGTLCSVRPPNGERFIRLRSLGADYTEDALKKRIEERGKFYDACRDKISKTKDMEKDFNVGVEKIVVLFHEKKIPPRKANRNKPYTFKNDYRINNMLNCLKLISRENINYENIQGKIEALQNRQAELIKNIGIAKDNQSTRAELIDRGYKYFLGSDNSDETKKQPP